MISKREKMGFTLIELLIVFAIIGLISSVITQNFTSSRAKARNNTRLDQIDQIHKALEISITSGSNKLPSSGGNWVCIGNTSPCAGGAFSSNTVVNNAIASGISGGTVSSIPKDPRFTAEIGDAYLYNSNLDPGTSEDCTPAICPIGVYLVWVSENSATCGRGIYWQNFGDKYQCILRIGDAVTS